MFIHESRTISNLNSASSLSKKAFLNAIASLLDFGARLLIGFILTPLLVTGLGDYFFGIWRILERMIGYISPVSGRSSKALKWTIANKQTSTNFEQKRLYVGCAICVWFLFLPLLITLGGTLSWFIPLWIHAPVDSIWIIRIAAGLLLTTLVTTSFAEEIPRSVLEGENYGYKRMGLSTAMVFLGGGITWIALYLDTGIAGVACAALISTLLRSIFFFIVAKKNTLWFGCAKPSISEIFKFLKLSLWFIGWNFIMKAMTSSDVILLGMFDSVVTVTTYTLTKYAPELLLTLIAVIVFGVTPGMGGIIGSGNFEKAKSIRNEIMLLSWFIATIVGSTVLLWNFSFIRLWVGDHHYAGAIPTLLIVISATQFVLIRNDANLIDLTLRLRKKVFYAIISVSISLILAWFFVYKLKMGITGLCLGMVIGRTVLSACYPFIVGRFLGITFGYQLKAILRPAFVTVIFFILAYKLNVINHSYPLFTISGWLDLIFMIILTLCLVTLMAFYGGLTKYQRNLIYRRIQLVIFSLHK